LGAEVERLVQDCIRAKCVAAHALLLSERFFNITIVIGVEHRELTVVRRTSFSASSKAKRCDAFVLTRCCGSFYAFIRRMRVKDVPHRPLPI
jgi:hypothetical protein